MADTEPVSLAEMDRRVAEWVENHPEELDVIEKAAKAAGEAILRDARVKPEDLRIPVTI